MIRVYIAGPLRDPDPEKLARNIEHAKHIAQIYWKLGYNVFCPHAAAGWLDGIIPDEQILPAMMEELERCDMIVFIDGWLDSVGSCAEYLRAIELKKKIAFERGRMNEPLEPKPADSGVTP